MGDLSNEIKADIDQRFDRIPPASKEVADTHEKIRAEFKRAARALSRLVPAGNREHALMLTELQSAANWAHNALATHHPDNQQAG